MSPASPAPEPGPRWRWLLDLPALAGGLYVCVLLGLTVAGRLAHPFDLEWMEGGMLLHALRVLEGEGLYVQPSGDFIPFIYPPLYHWLLGGIGLLTGGIDYLPGRAVSLAGTLTGAAALAVGLRREGANPVLALAVAALFLSTYDESGAFFDLVRIDGLLLALWGWSLVAVRAGWLRVGGLLLVAAFATKHHAAAFGLPALIWLWRGQGRGAAARFAAWSVGPALAFMVGMAFEGDGMFLTYLLGVPAGHGIVASRLFVGAPTELVTGLPVLAAAAAAGLALTRGRTPGAGWYWSVQCALALFLACLMRGHHGGFKNVLIPGYWAVSMLGGLGVVALRGRLPQVGVAAALAVALGVQGWLGRWEPVRFHPAPGDAEAGARVVARLAEIDGEVLAPWQPWMAVQAGKRPAFHLIALWDIDHKWGPLVDDVPAIEADIAAWRWAAVLTVNDRPEYGVRSAYVRGALVRPAGDALMPKTGWRVRPHRIWERPPTDDADPTPGGPEPAPGGGGDPAVEAPAAGAG